MTLPSRYPAPAVRGEVAAFHRAQVVIDLHLDFVLQMRMFGYDPSRGHDIVMRRQPFVGHADVPRLVEGGVTGVALGIHRVPIESKRAWDEVERQLDLVDALIERDARLVRCETAADFEDAAKAGRVGVTTGLEGAHLLGGDLRNVERGARRGALYMTLAHFSKNPACTPSMGLGADERSGLTGFGRELVAELERVKMLVDVAHVNEQGVLDVCAVATHPVLATHTICKGLRNHARGITDEGVRAIAATGGVIGIIMAPNFLDGTLSATTAAVSQHARHVARLVGAQHLAHGSDFDGWVPAIPADMRDVRDVDVYTQRLLDDGMSEAETSGVLGGNFLRVLRDVRNDARHFS